MDKTEECTVRTDDKGDATKENNAMTSSFKKPVLIFTVNKSVNRPMYKYSSTPNDKRFLVALKTKHARNLKFVRPNVN
jgi:hypothetical protein